ncbi:MAG TPA: hypothetical protein VGK67_28320 [Myxococcales bacterium]
MNGSLAAMAVSSPKVRSFPDASCSDCSPRGWSSGSEARKWSPGSVSSVASVSGAD